MSSPTTDNAMLKRRATETTKPTTGQSPRRRRKMRGAKPVVELCPKDHVSPRIPSLFREFAKSSPITEHMHWLRYLQLSCENQGCCVAGCATGSRCQGRNLAFARAHGAKTLMNGMNMFITYHIPRYYGVSSDDEWREALAALRSFHAFCVRRRYVQDDSTLMRALHRLKGFRIHTIPKMMQCLMEEKYWDMVEHVSGDREGVDKEGMEKNENDAEAYEEFISDGTTVVVEQIEEDGWVLMMESSAESDEKVFLSLPVEVALLGMKGMSISCVRFAMRKGIWRPIPIEDEGVKLIVYPPDEAFY